MNRRFAALLVVLVALLPFAWCFGEPLLFSKSFGLRDTARFYYPLFAWIEAEWSAGRVPLWNPLENSGMPAVGDTTSSIFYPGKLLLRLPLNFAFKFKLYVALHILAAFATAYWLARCWRASPLAACLCAVSYAFGGYVLFQHANVVFLVSAAWLPLSVLTADRMLRRRSPYWAVLFGMTLAMMTLGGDPQAAYHAGLLATGYALLLAVRRRQVGRVRRRGQAAESRRDAVGPRRGSRQDSRRSSRHSSHQSENQSENQSASRRSREAASRQDMPAVPAERQSARPFARRPLVLLAIAALVGGILAAIQIVPSAQWGARSERAAFRAPRNIYQVPTVLMRESRRRAVEGPRAADEPSLVRQGLFGSPPLGSHHRNLYRFSIQPWRLAELFWPNLGGKPYPINRSLMLAWNQDEPDWTPSLYIGLLPVLLGLATWTLRGHSPRVRWMSWTVLLAVVGSFGWYGPGWLLRATGVLAGGGGGESALGEPVGGLYWLLLMVLPGYDQFRFPAKLFLLASLGLSVLAAVGWDRACRGSRRSIRLVLAVAGVSVVGLMAALAVRPLVAAWLDQFPPDPMFGPLVGERASWDLVVCFIHTLTVSVAAWWLLRAVSAKASVWYRVAAVALTSVELALAQGWMIATAPDDVSDRAAWASTVIEQHAGPRAPPFRVSRDNSPVWQPGSWSTQSSPRRVEEALVWHRETLHTRWHLTAGLAVDEAAASVMSDDFQAVIGIAREFGPRGLGGAPQPHPLLLDALGVRYLVQSSDGNVNRLNKSLGRVAIEELPGEDAAVWLNPRHFPRAWIVHRLERLPEVDTSDPAMVDALTAHGFFPNDQPRDLRSEAAIEVLVSTAPLVRPPDVVPVEELCRVIRHGPQVVEIHAALIQPGMVVLSDLYDREWQARVTDVAAGRSQRVDVVRANRIMRGVFLPPGEFVILYEYRPWGFWCGAVLSVAGWMACFVYLSWSCCGRKRHQAS